MENNELSKIEERLAKFRKEKEKEEQQRIKLCELEKAFYEADKEAEKEKGKRNLILISFYSVISGYIISHFFETIDIEAVFMIILFSLISGIVLWIVPLSVFHVVTELFTNVDSAEARRNYLEKEIKRIKRDYY